MLCVTSEFQGRAKYDEAGLCAYLSLRMSNLINLSERRATVDGGGLRTSTQSVSVAGAAAWGLSDSSRIRPASSVPLRDQWWSAIVKCSSILGRLNGSAAQRSCEVMADLARHDDCRWPSDSNEILVASSPAIK